MQMGLLLISCNVVALPVSIHVKEYLPDCSSTKHTSACCYRLFLLCCFCFCHIQTHSQGIGLWVNKIVGLTTRLSDKKLWAKIVLVRLVLEPPGAGRKSVLVLLVVGSWCLILIISIPCSTHHCCLCQLLYWPGSVIDPLCHNLAKRHNLLLIGRDSSRGLSGPGTVPKLKRFCVIHILSNHLGIVGDEIPSVKDAGRHGVVVLTSKRHDGVAN